MSYENCTFCNGDSKLNVRPGYFRDLDTDLFNNIGICPGCAGLGVVVEGDSTLEKYKSEIYALRSKYIGYGFVSISEKITEKQREEIEKVMSAIKSKLKIITTEVLKLYKDKAVENSFLFYYSSL